MLQSNRPAPFFWQETRRYHIAEQYFGHTRFFNRSWDRDHKTAPGATRQRYLKITASTLRIASLSPMGTTNR